MALTQACSCFNISQKTIADQKKGQEVFGGDISKTSYIFFCKIFFTNFLQNRLTNFLQNPCELLTND
jgi:hypothetical protein